MQNDLKRTWIFNTRAACAALPCRKQEVHMMVSEETVRGCQKMKHLSTDTRELYLNQLFVLCDFSSRTCAPAFIHVFSLSHVRACDCVCVWAGGRQRCWTAESQAGVMKFRETSEPPERRRAATLSITMRRAGQ